MNGILQILSLISSLSFLLAENMMKCCRSNLSLHPYLSVSTGVQESLKQLTFLFLC